MGVGVAGLGLLFGDLGRGGVHDGFAKCKPGEQRHAEEREDFLHVRVPFRLC